MDLENKNCGLSKHQTQNKHNTISKIYVCPAKSDEPLKDFQDQNTQSNEGELLPNFDTWFKEMMGDGQTVEHGGGDGQHDGVQEGQVREEGVHAQGGEVMGEGEGGEGGEGGQGGKVKLAVERLEEGNTGLKLPRFVKPSGRRGVKRDGLVQTQIDNLVRLGGGSKLTGLVRGEGKRKLPTDTDSPGAKVRRLVADRPVS